MEQPSTTRPPSMPMRLGTTDPERVRASLLARTSDSTLIRIVGDYVDSPFGSEGHVILMACLLEARIRAVQPSAR